MYGVIGVAEAGVGSLAVSLGNRRFIPTLGYTAWNSSVLSEWSCRTKMSKGEVLSYEPNLDELRFGQVVTETSSIHVSVDRTDGDN